MRKPSDSFEELRFGFVIVNLEKRGQGYGKNSKRQILRLPLNLTPLL